MSPRFFGCLAMTVLMVVTLSAADERPRPGQRTASEGVRKPQISDTVRANIYADNWFMLYINGELVAVDSIRFLPHNVISVDVLPLYPMTLAVMAKDNADPQTGMEYANTQIGDAGFVLKLGDGTVTDASWQALRISHGPVDGDTQQPRVENFDVPENWYGVDFDDSGWKPARTYTVEEVDPKQAYFDHDFVGAKFIWTDDLSLDNTVLFRKVVTAPPDGKPRPDFSNLNNIVPAGPPRRPRR